MAEQHWITIGAKAGADGEKHGGTPVLIESGKIVGGPDSLRGRSLAELTGKDADEHRLGDPKDFIKSLIEEHDKQERSNAERREHIESLGIAWKSYKAIRYQPGTEAHTRSVEADTERRRQAQQEAEKEKQQWKEEQEIRKREAEIEEAKKRADRETKIANEIESNANVEPHWPTYRSIMSLAGDWAEYRDAVRYRDIGDVLAFKSAAESFEELILRHAENLGTLGSEIWETMRRTGRASEKQIKALAVAVAKAVARKGD